MSIRDKYQDTDVSTFVSSVILFKFPAPDAHNLIVHRPSSYQLQFHHLTPTQDTMVLHHKIFFSSRPSATRTGPTGSDHLRHVPTTSTLIYGKNDAVLVDTQLTIEAANDLTNWVLASGKNLTAIYITHSHGDHHFGTSTLLTHFPDTQVLATPEVASRMQKECGPERLRDFWGKLFPGQIPFTFASATPLPTDEFELEGEKLVVLRLGHTDCDETTALWVPSIKLLVAGDSVYGNTHPYMGESGTVESRAEWVKALEQLAGLGAEVVVGGHSDPESSFGPEAIEETKKYFEDFERIAEGAESADEVYEKMMEVYPEKLNPGSLWSGAVLAKAK